MARRAHRPSSGPRSRRGGLGSDGCSGPHDGGGERGRGARRCRAPDAARGRRHLRRERRSGGRHAGRGAGARRGGTRCGAGHPRPDDARAAHPDHRAGPARAVRHLPGGPVAGAAVLVARRRVDRRPRARGVDGDRLRLLPGAGRGAQLRHAGAAQERRHAERARGGGRRARGGSGGPGGHPAPGPWPGRAHRPRAGQHAVRAGQPGAGVRRGSAPRRCRRSGARAVRRGHRRAPGARRPSCPRHRPAGGADVAGGGAGVARAARPGGGRCAGRCAARRCAGRGARRGACRTTTVRA